MLVGHGNEMVTVLSGVSKITDPLEVCARAMDTRIRCAFVAIWNEIVVKNHISRAAGIAAVLDVAMVTGTDRKSLNVHQLVIVSSR